MKFSGTLKHWLDNIQSASWAGWINTLIRPHGWVPASGPTTDGIFCSSVREKPELQKARAVWIPAGSLWPLWKASGGGEFIGIYSKQPATLAKLFLSILCGSGGGKWRDTAPLDGPYETLSWFHSRNEFTRQSNTTPNTFGSSLWVTGVGGACLPWPQNATLDKTPDLPCSL